MPQEESLDQYHLYTLPGQTDIGNNQTKQVALLSAPRVPVARELVVRGQSYSYRAQSPDGWTKLPVASMLSFVNRDGSLGIPLPKGVVRVYSKDSRGNAQFLGEDAIDHTPKGETVKLKLGESFDVTARRKQTSFKKLSGTSAFNYAFEAGFEMELKNARPGAGHGEGPRGAARRLDHGPREPAPHPGVRQSRFMAGPGPGGGDRQPDLACPSAVLRPALQWSPGPSRDVWMSGCRMSGCRDRQPCTGPALPGNEAISPGNAQQPHLTPSPGLAKLPASFGRIALSGRALPLHGSVYDLRA